MRFFYFCYEQTDGKGNFKYSRIFFKILKIGEYFSV
jgi:hypothetical protein